MPDNDPSPDTAASGGSAGLPPEGRVASAGHSPAEVSVESEALMHRWMVSAAVLLSACAGTEAAPLSVATIDTLPGGIVEVMSPGPTAWADTSGWQLVPAGQLEGGIGMPGELIDPRDIAVGDDGAVYVADSDPAVIKVYDSTGAFVRTIGREGEGPGEFQVAYLAVRDGHLLVQDPQLSRASLFDTAGGYIRSWSTTCCYFGTPAMDDQGRITLLAMNTPDMHASTVLYRYDTLGTMLDTLRLLEPEVEVPLWTLSEGNMRRMTMPVLFSPANLFGYRRAGGVIQGWSGNYRLVASETGRDTLRVFGRAWTAEPLDDARRDREYEERMAPIIQGGADEVTVRNQMSKDDIPAHLPAFEAIAQDARGAIWVTLDTDSALARFDVFDSAGVYLGRVNAPGSIPAWHAAWGRDAVYVRGEDADGFPRVARYRIVRD